MRFKIILHLEPMLNHLEPTKEKNRAELVNTVLGIKDFQSVLDVVSIHIISHLNVLCTQILQKDVNIYEIT